MLKEFSIVVLAIITAFFLFKLYSEYRLNGLLKRKHKLMRVENAYPVRKASFMKALVPAATMAIVVLINPGVSFEPTLNNVELAEISSEADLLAIYKEYTDSTNNWIKNSRDGFETLDIVVPEAMNMDVLTITTDSEKAGSYTETNVQVQGVDEIDNVKTDGTYIYSINYGRSDGSSNVVISLAYPATDLSVYKTLTFSNNDCDKFCSSEYVNGVYVDDDYLIVVTNRNTYVNYNDSKDEDSVETYKMIEPFFGQTETVVYVYDKSNDFELKDTYKFEGYMSGTRKIGSNLFIITNQWFNASDDTLLPQYIVNGETLTGEFSDVTYVKDTTPNNFTSIYGIDLDGSDISVQNILGSSSYTLYVSNNNIYTIDYRYIQTFRTSIGLIADNSESEQTIAISKYAIDGNVVTLAAVGEVKGSPLNQFSMDEYNGFFRITTTSGWGDKTNNRLYVLNEGLTIVAELNNLGKPGERLQSTRFMGDIAYLVTFETSDPFYVIDLSDPLNPEILGELEISGFSTYLHPIDSTHMMGIGFEADENGRRTGLKISIYDVTDQTNPLETFKYVILYEEQGWNYSSVTYNHKDLLFDVNKGIIGFPFSSEVYENNKYNWESGYLLFNFDVDTGLDKLGYITHGPSEEYYDNIQKGLFLDDYLYTVANTKIGVSHLDDVENLIKLIKLEQ